MKRHKHRLVNAVARSTEYPDTFHIPTEIHREAVKVGDLVKLGFEVIEPDENEFSERMWVIVTGSLTAVTHKGTLRSIWFTGVIDNTPSSLSLAYKDKVDFTPDNILAIWEDDWLEEGKHVDSGDAIDLLHKWLAIDTDMGIDTDRAGELVSETKILLGKEILDG